MVRKQEEEAETVVEEEETREEPEEGKRPEDDPVLKDLSEDELRGAEAVAAVLAKRLRKEEERPIEDPKVQEELARAKANEFQALDALRTANSKIASLRVEIETKDDRIRGTSRGQFSQRRGAIEWAVHAYKITGSLRGAVEYMAGPKRNWVPLFVAFLWLVYGLVVIEEASSPQISTGEEVTLFAVGLMFLVLSWMLLRRKDSYSG